MVGVVGEGKTTRARQIAVERHAVRYTRRRDVVEGRLVSLALDLLRIGVDVILDFGCWVKPERTALRFLAASVGAGCELVYVTVPRDEQTRRVADRGPESLDTAFPITDAELGEWADAFEVPEADELDDGPLDPPADGFPDRGAWAVERWPSLTA